MNDQFNINAKKRFEEIKQKLKVNLQKPILEKATGIILDTEKLQKMLYDPVFRPEKREFDEACHEAISVAKEVDVSLDFITSLNLPPELSIAMAYIISANKKKSIQELEEASLCLAKQIQNWKK